MAEWSFSQRIGYLEKQTS